MSAQSFKYRITGNQLSFLALANGFHKELVFNNLIQNARKVITILFKSFRHRFLNNRLQLFPFN